MFLDSRSNLSSLNGSRTDLRGSSNTLQEDERSSQKQSSSNNTVIPKRTGKNEQFASTGNLGNNTDNTIDSDDDIDGTFEKAKMVS